MKANTPIIEGLQNAINEVTQLREINKELVEIAQSFRILLAHAHVDIHPELQKRLLVAVYKAENPA